MFGITLGSFFYHLPHRALTTYKSFTADSTKKVNSIREKNETNRMVFFICGPLAVLAGLILVEPVIKYVLGLQQFLSQVSFLVV